MKKFLAFLFAFVTAALLCVAPALSQPAPQDEVAWYTWASNTSDIVLSPDGNSLYASTQDTTTLNFCIREYSASDGHIIRTMTPQNHNTNIRIGDIEITPDGHYLAAVYEEYSPVIMIFDLQNGSYREIKCDTITSQVGFKDITISPDGKKIIGVSSESYSPDLVGYYLETGEQWFAYSYPHDSDSSGTYLFDRVEFSPDGSFFVTAGIQTKNIGGGQYSNRYYLLAWDSSQIPQLIHKIPINLNVDKDKSSSSKMIKFSAASSLLGFGYENRIEFYNYHTWDSISSISYNGNPVGIWSFAFNHSDGQKVSVCAYENQSYIKETQSILPPRQLYSYDTIFTFSIVSNDDNFIYGMGLRGVYKLYAKWESTGIKKEHKAQEILSLYPNPSMEQLSIDVNLSLPQQSSITLSDAQGNKVSDVYTGIIELTRKINFDLSGISSGSYFITLKYSDKIISQYFIKEK